MNNHNRDAEKLDNSIRMYWAMAATYARQGSLRGERACYKAILALQPDNKKAQAWLKTLPQPS